MENPRYKLIILLVLFATVVVGVNVILRGRNQKPEPTLAASQSMVPENITNIESPDGKAWLTINRKNVDGQINLSIYFNQVDGQKHEIYSKTLVKENDLEIPFNTFSPDNKYIFLKITENGQISYPVISTNLKLNTENNQRAEIASLFSEKYPQYLITDVTGWGGTGLIIINTDKAEGGKGPSFWFDVTSNSFIQLSSRFD